ncbi:MAG: hypothetical protein J6D47_12595 [Peptostreptococcaceae bacterium]|nr:hypothetical protein [Peptostreptococcaceae bacterium]
MKLTTNYSLKKPEGSDVVNIDDFNYNADIVDNAIQEIKNTSSTNKINISNLQTKVNNGQVIKMTQDNGACITIPNNNANDITTTGFFMGQNVINAPQSAKGWVYIESLVHNGSHQVQKATDLHDSSKRWTRHQTSGSWSEWREL